MDQKNMVCWTFYWDQHFIPVRNWRTCSAVHLLVVELATMPHRPKTNFANSFAKTRAGSVLKNIFFKLHVFDQITCRRTLHVFRDILFQFCESLHVLFPRRYFLYRFKGRLVTYEPHRQCWLPILFMHHGFWYCVWGLTPHQSEPSRNKQWNATCIGNQSRSFCNHCRFVFSHQPWGDRDQAAHI